MDEQALIEAPKNRWFAGARLDVEPLPLDHPIRSLGNVTLSPHTAGLSDDNWKASQRRSRTAAANDMALGR